MSESTINISYIDPKNVLSKKHLFTYIGILIKYSFFFLVPAVSSYFLSPITYPNIELYLSIYYLWIGLFFIYNLMHNASHKLFWDNRGVWYYRGVFPWQKRVSGVFWADLSEATMNQGFFNWLFRIHDILITDKFTKGKEIGLTNMSRVKKAVTFIDNNRKTFT